MTSSSKLGHAFTLEQPLFGNDLSTCEGQGPAERSMRVLDRLATALGVPVEAFFDETSRSKHNAEATAAEIAELTRAFAAISDPVMRRYCLDVVAAASAEEPSPGRNATPD
jgi:hypothetical protein